MKTIFRKRLKNRFTMMPNSALQDERLSFKARGILALVLTKPDDWRINLVWLEKQASEGREAVRKAMKELSALGYCRKVLIQSPDTGHLIQTIWQFTDSPTDGFPSDGKPPSRKTAATNTLVTNTVVTKDSLGAFQPARAIPSSPEDMIDTIQAETENQLDGQAETIAAKFYDEMQKTAWTINRQPIRDWIKVLSSRIEKTTGENILKQSLYSIAF